ncbi:MAG TPA: alpha-glucosidase [Candidatus Hydrogenedentes bacterium]|nr:alpha-glucosidase [Candidatus Hydrogenedentota bacterium]
MTTYNEDSQSIENNIHGMLVRRETFLNKRFRLLLVAILVLVILVGGWALFTDTPERSVSGTLTRGYACPPSAHYTLGAFSVVWTTEQGGCLEVRHRDAPERVLWATVPGTSFAAAGRGQERVTESRGSYKIKDALSRICTNQTIESIVQEPDRLLVKGMLTGLRAAGTVGYVFSLESVGENQIAFALSLSDSTYNRSWMTYASEPDEHFFGFGEQFSCFDLKGKRVPIVVQEQGIGRGLQPITFLVNLVAGAGGSWDASYACVPHYITSKCRSLFLENSEYTVFDLRQGNRVEVKVFSSRLCGRILQGDTPAGLVEEYTACTGRMRPLPDWIHEGAVVGMQGGTEKVRQVLAALKEHDTPIAAFWLQDWVGPRTTSIGKQLWWNWELDRDTYPEWNTLREELDADGIRLMTYINPFLADVSEKPNARRNLFQEAAEKGLLVRDSGGNPCLIPNTSFSAGLLDLTNPAACVWMKEVIRDQVIAEGASGWMADFGEALPYDAVLHSGEPASSFHNRYPEAWARLNREAIDDTGRGEDFVFFTRSGYRSSPRYTTLQWLGDQLVTWDAYDGIKTAVIGLLSSGLSGFSFNHSDIGGYTTFSMPLLGYQRSRELLFRWMELNAFTTLFRTHEGNQPESNVQFYDDEETLAYFSRFARVHKAWGFYRAQLIEEAGRTGLPVVRPLFLHYPGDENTYSLSYQQFLVGPDLMVAPVLAPRRNSVVVYFPEGAWIHIWSGNSYGGIHPRSRETVSAPLGRPAVFYRSRSETGPRFMEELRREGLLE